MNSLNSADNQVIVQGLSVSYFQHKKEVPALKEVSFAIPRGSTCALIGPSGCGKSSLLYVLSGLMRPSGGSVMVDGETLTAPRLSTALILQDYGLLPWKKVAENVGLGLEIRGIKREPRLDRVKRILQEVGLWELRNRYPSQLSGGQRQRVGIARALAQEPDLLLMDEPFSSLDALTRETLQEQLLHIWKNKRITIVMVTHSIEEAIYLGQQIIVLSGSPGRLLEVVSNPGVGNADYRNTPEFHKLSTMLRSKLSR
ncbi:NitT/TauT family transport system ATP-binding protein [Desulfotomaculum arcticum]|uniref:NitT/TauT family transport system ATP-binding protein n=1 Tax=Desulfotruncus arcticus DSM 17038 TaxID=1121424 RepID=A0A1I2THF2_9FIRM|nr:ABC transporter ATP-binding protein [Desulfotruncus arcticus]SFG64350.1 NitT/TauT family transport system ATP-binding protein [Desulfotomaculum arcticum] [Desulfotruncus arcticus DSM 17038]